MSQAQELSELLYQVLAEPIGLLLRTPDPGRLRQQLYAARAKLADQSLNVIQIRVSPWSEGDLVLCKSGPLAIAAPQNEKEPA